MTGEPFRLDPDAGAILERYSSLHVSVISDCLDAVGLRDRVMAPHIRPLQPAMRLVGFARTVALVPVESPPADPADNYRNELRAVESLQPGDVMVTSTCHRSYFGELLATASRYRGARGLVADAYTRDTKKLVEMQFPTFVAGIQAQDSLGRLDVSDVDVEIECAGVTVQPRDIVVGDGDGVVVVPASVVDEVAELAERKLGTEDEMRASLAGGMPMGEAFATYQVL